MQLKCEYRTGKLQERCQKRHVVQNVATLEHAHSLCHAVVDKRLLGMDSNGITG